MPVTIRGLAIGLTVWFAVVGVSMFAVTQFRLPLDAPLIQILFMYSYFLLPVRWALVLTLQIRRAREMVARLPPRAITITVIVVVQSVLGFLSFAGFYSLADQQIGKTGDRILGLFTHVVIPVAMVAYLTRRATVGVAAPAAGVAHTG